MAWAAVLVANAAPAEALIITDQTFQPYAACSNNIWAQTVGHCFVEHTLDDDIYEVYTGYKQLIKLVSEGCNWRNCSQMDPMVFTEFVYGTGRKAVSAAGSLPCDESMYMYALGSCAC